MIVVIVEIYVNRRDYDDTKIEIENVYGPYNTDLININDKIIELENKRKSKLCTFEIMPLIAA